MAHKTYIALSLLICITPSVAKADESSQAWDLNFSGYGELHFKHYNYGPDPTAEGGSLPDNRAAFDTTRLILELEGELPEDLQLEAEIEFEHGGTGTALELEYEEFGEYEAEIEHGGEVVLETLKIQKSWDEVVTVGAGRFYVAVGFLSAHHGPLDFLGADRPESETTVIPAVWDEMGIFVEHQNRWVRVQLQVVTGLDSTGFSSQHWIASGHQRRFEETRASDLAAVARLDIIGLDGLVLGASGYRGKTIDNRPKTDLKGFEGTLTLMDVHIKFSRGGFTFNGLGLWGSLEDSSAISDKNRRLSNNLNVLRSQVASNAHAVWAEAGLEILQFVSSKDSHRLTLFSRVEHYDTMTTVEEGFDNPRFEKLIFSGGCAYMYHDALALKLDFTHRRVGGDSLRNEDTIKGAIGFVF